MDQEQLYATVVEAGGHVHVEPASSNAVQLPLEPASAVHIHVRIVAIRGNNGHIDDWAAYWAPATWSTNAIVSNGHKLPESAARLFFPRTQGTYRA